MKNPRSRYRDRFLNDFNRFRDRFGPQKSIKKRLKRRSEIDQKTDVVFYTFVSIFGVFWGPKWHPKAAQNRLKMTSDRKFPDFWSLWAPGRPWDSIFIDFWPFWERFFADFNRFGVDRARFFAGKKSRFLPICIDFYISPHFRYTVFYNTKQCFLKITILVTGIVFGAIVVDFGTVLDLKNRFKKNVKNDVPGDSDLRHCNPSETRGLASKTRRLHWGPIFADF